MKITYRAAKGVGVYFIIGLMILYDAVLIFLINFVNSYEIYNLLKFTLLFLNLYQLYYIVICGTLKYSMDEDNLYITSALSLKNEEIPFKTIQMYQSSQGHIRGVKLSGYGKNKFAIGRSFIDKIGNTYMFVTSTKNVVYLKTDTANYGLSPENFKKFTEELEKRRINCFKWENRLSKSISINKEPKFFIPFIITSIVVVLLALIPIILYLYGKLPDRMPVSFDTRFMAVKFGTGKQFAFKQMSYGILNMGVLFCMYYAGYIYSKYDKRYSYKYIYISFIVALFYFIMQIRILCTFR
ncbi:MULTISPECIES: PH domain-containing protein [Clostridium]